MTVTAERPVADPMAELRRQTDVLVGKGYAALAGLTDEAFRDLAAPLENRVPDEPFVLVVTGAVVPLVRRWS